MNIKSGSLSFVAIVITFNLLAQKESKKLDVGDYFPPYQLTNLINFPTSSTELSRFKGKLLILDFWSTNCASCIHSWPKLLDLQEEFGDRVQIILVNPWQGKNIVKEIIEKQSKNAGVNMTLPIVCKDSSILDWVPVSGLPHVVWINEDGIVKGITDGNVLNSQNVEAVLDDKYFLLPKKVNNNELVAPNFNEPLYINGNGGYVNKVLEYSILTKAVPGTFPGITITANKELGYYITATNSPIGLLYRLAYSNRRTYSRGDIVPLPISKMALEVKDTTRFVTFINGNIIWENHYNYQTISDKPTTEKELQDIMKSDLERYFGLEVSWESRKVKCYVLTAEDTSLIAYKSGKKDLRLDPYWCKLNKVPLSFFIECIESGTNLYYSKLPILDETNYNGLINLSLEVDFSSPESLDKALWENYKMRFTIRERVVDMLVIRESV